MRARQRIKFFFLVNEISCFSACGSALCLINPVLCIFTSSLFYRCKPNAFQKEDEHKREREFGIHGHDPRGALFPRVPCDAFLEVPPLELPGRHDTLELPGRHCFPQEPVSGGTTRDRSGFSGEPEKRITGEAVSPGNLLIH